jgi:hypothetical protein
MIARLKVTGYTSAPITVTAAELEAAKRAPSMGLLCQLAELREKQEAADRDDSAWRRIYQERIP